MNQIWSVFGKPELQGYIGEETIDRLQTILPALLGVDWNPDEILYKQNLVEIFEAFAGAKALKARDFREALFRHLSKEKLVDLAGGRSAGGSASHEDLVGQLAKKPWTPSEFTERAVRVLELPQHLVPARREVAPEVRTVEAPKVPLKTLKDYQFTVFQEAQARLRTPNSRFIIQMPTGSGKTRTAMEILAEWFNSFGGPTTVVWLAHSVELCDQAQAAFQEVWSHLGTFDIPVFSVWGGNARLPSDPGGPALIIGGFPKLHSLEKSGAIPAELASRVTLIVVDEAHKVLAPTYRAVVDRLRGPNTRVVGLTATPGRSAVDESQNAQLAEFFFEELVTLDSGRESVFPYLRRRGILSEVVRETLFTHQDFQLTAKDQEYLATFYDLPRTFLARLGANDLRNVEIVRRVRRYVEEGRRILLFACSVEQSKFLCALLTFLGVRAAHLDGSTEASHRRFLIDGFRGGELQVLSNYGVLSTGFDAPQTDVVFIARPTASVVLYSQMVGRGLRGPAIGGTERCIVVDVRDNIMGLEAPDSLYAYFDDYFVGDS
jgi:DNA repair protein RadD